MKVFFSQVYVQVGISFPFSHVFQKFLSAEMTEILQPSPMFIGCYGEDYELMFRISAKQELESMEIKGPSIYRKTKDIEYTLFLPYTSIMKEPEPNKIALEYLYEGVYCVLSKYEINVSNLKTEQDRTIHKILTTPGMLKS